MAGRDRDGRQARCFAHGARADHAAGGRARPLAGFRAGEDRDLVVTLQSFDRLKQEFEALGDALTHYAESHATPISGAERAQVEQNVIAAITVSDLKERLLRRLQDDVPAVPAPPLSEAEAAEVDVDVVF